MKISVLELKNKTSMDIVYDYRNDIQKIDDILGIDLAKIHLEPKFIDDDLFLNITVDVKLVLACAKTLKPVDYDMHITEEIIFGKHEDADYVLEDELPLQEIIFGYIISEKPFVVYHTDAKDILFEKEKGPHPAFADLDKFLKK